MKKEENPWTIVVSDLKYDNLWIRVTKHDVLNPAGNPGEYGIVHFKHLAIGILPVDSEGNSWIVGQYRLPLERFTWEIPEGGGKLGVDPLESAKRELREEAGIIANDWREIQRMDLSNSATDEHAILYLARDLEFVAPEPDEDEQISLKKVSFNALYEMVLSGEIIDSLSVAAILKYKVMLDNNLI